MDLLSSEGALAVPGQYWPWMVVAVILGIIIGWMTGNFVEQSR